VFGFGSQLELSGDYAFLAALIGNPVTWHTQVRYSDLRAFGPDWRFDLSAFVRNEVTLRLGEIFGFGASIALTRKVTPALSVFGRVDAYISNIQVAFIRLLASNDSSSATDNTLTTRTLVGVIWDRRVDSSGQLNPLAPIKGWRLSATTGVAYTPFPYFLVSGQALGMLPFKVRGVEFLLTADARYDQGIPFSGPALPLVERFYGGGDTTTRGFDTDTLKHEIVYTQVSPLSGGSAFRIVPEGGNIRFLNTIDFQFPIAKTFFGLPLGWSGALFWDVGAITNALNQVALHDFRHAIGISVLRLITPVGPLSIEYAYPLTQTLADERWKTAPWYTHFPGRIHFNWGIPLSRL
jgi:outer membrane protein assembly factor BamA